MYEVSAPFCITCWKTLIRLVSVCYAEFLLFRCLNTVVMKLVLSQKEKGNLYQNFESNPCSDLTKVTIDLQIDIRVLFRRSERGFTSQLRLI